MVKDIHRCLCEPGFYGLYCEIHVDCGQWSVSRSDWDNRTCTLVAVPDESSWANCSCTASEGDFTLRTREMTMRWLPSSNVQLTAENLDMLARKLHTSPNGWLLVACLLLLWVVASLLALHQDCRHVYVREVPSWMWAPVKFS